ncbi:MAG: ABC transporter ATP-binding protein [Kiritimatiellia bacterium]|jgi:ABC-2 type transport system ATP-binding protein
MELLRLSGVTKSFGAVRAVDALDLALHRGEILGFLGTNGAGKTTTIKMLLGLVAPDSGSVAVFGADPRHASTRRRIGFMPEMAHYYPFLTPRELLRFYGGLCGMDAAAIAWRSNDLLGKVGLAEAADRPLKTCSKGMLQRAGIAQALLHDPDLLILDEPFTGLDPLARIQLRDLLLTQRAAGKTVFFSSHELSEAELISDRVAILKAGRCVYEGTVKQIAGDGGGNLERIFLDVLKRSDAERKGARP